MPSTLQACIGREPRAAQTWRNEQACNKSAQFRSSQESLIITIIHNVNVTKLASCVVTQISSFHVSKSSAKWHAIPCRHAIMQVCSSSPRSRVTPCLADARCPIDCAIWQYWASAVVTGDSFVEAVAKGQSRSGMLSHGRPSTSLQYVAHAENLELWVPAVHCRVLHSLVPGRGRLVPLQRRS